MAAPSESERLELHYSLAKYKVQTDAEGGNWGGRGTPWSCHDQVTGLRQSHQLTKQICMSLHCLITGSGVWVK